MFGTQGFRSRTPTHIFSQFEVTGVQISLRTDPAPVADTGFVIVTSLEVGGITDEDIASDVKGFQEISRPEVYDGLDGGILEGLGKLFPDGTTAYVCPTVEDGKRLTLDAMEFAESLRPLSAYLRGLGRLVSADDFEQSAGD